MGASGVIDHPHPGQNAEFGVIVVPQCGHFTEGCEAFAEPLSELLSGPFAELDNSASIALLSAFFANAVDLERVTGGNVAVLAADFLLDLSNLLREKFDRGAALGTNHVVMTAAIVLVFVARYAVMKSHFAGQSTTRQQLQRPIDSSEADARIGFFDQPMQFVDGEMFARFQESPKNRAALSSLLQADALKMLQENAFRFADVFPRDNFLIVDSFLQHVGRRRKSR